jgi:hypothetical protein
VLGSKKLGLCLGDGLFDGVTKEMIHKVYQTMDREEMEFPEVFTKKICELACK